MDTLELTPAQFRQDLLIDTDAGPRPLADVIDDWQRQDFEALEPAWLRVAGHDIGACKSRAWLERSRGHSKTSDLAVQCAWVLAYSRRHVSGVAAAADKDQARLLRDAIRRLCSLNRWLAAILEVQAHKVVNKVNDSTLEIISSDLSSSYGITPDFVIADEVTHWKTRELFDSLFSSAAKRSHCLFLVATNAGFSDSWQAIVRDAIRNDDRWHFSSLTGPVATWLSQAILEEQRKVLPEAAFSRLWLNQWADGAGDAINADDILAAVKAELSQVTRPEVGWRYVAGVDLGLTKDSSAVVVLGFQPSWYEAVFDDCAVSDTMAAMIDMGIMPSTVREPTEVFHEGSDRIRLVSVRAFKPPVGGRVSLSEVEQYIEGLYGAFGRQLVSIGIEPYQAEQMLERLSLRCLPVEHFNTSPANLQAAATATLSAFRERRLDLFHEADFIADIRGLRCQEQRGGASFRLVSSRNKAGHSGTAHCDLATAFSIAIALTERQKQASERISVSGPLLVW
jgi:hypothetical protein